MNETIISVGYNEEMAMFYVQVDKTQIMLSPEDMRKLEFQISCSVDSYLRSQCKTCGGQGVIADSLNKESVIDCPECR